MSSEGTRTRGPQAQPPDEAVPAVRSEDVRKRGLSDHASEGPSYDEQATQQINLRSDRSDADPGGRKFPMDEFKETLNEYWKAANGSGSRIPDSMVTEMRHSAFMRFFQRQRASNDRPVARPGLVRGSLPEVTLRLRNEYLAVHNQADALAPFLSTSVADHVEWLETSRTATRVQVADLILGMFQRAEAALYPDLVLYLASHLRGYIDPEHKRDPDWWGTLGGIGDFCEHERLDVNVRSIVYYVEMMTEVAEAWKERPDSAVSGPAWRLASVPLNNVTGRLSEIATSGDDDGDSTIRNDVFGLMLKTLSVSTGFALAGDPDPGRRPRLPALWDEDAWSESSTDPIWELVDRAMTVPTVHNHRAASRVSLGYATAISAVGRLHGGRQNRTPAAFFNAGIDLLRAVQDLADDDAANIVRTRVVLNALGTFWSLEIEKPALDGLDRVLTDATNRAGLECLVNLFGSLAEAQRRRLGTSRTQDLSRQLSALVPELLQVLRPRPWVSAALARIQNSMASMGLPAREANSASPELPERIRECARDLADDLSRAMGLPDPPSGASAYAWTADRVRTAFEMGICEGSPDRILSLRRDVEQLLQPFADATEDPVAAFLELVESWKTSPPLVSQGVIDRATWDEARAARLVRTDSMAQALRQVPAPPST